MPCYTNNRFRNRNGLAASVQCFFRDTVDAHRYVPSPRNQRIESWWGQLSKQRSIWWRAFFADLESQNVYNRTIELHEEALWFTFSSIIQSDLDSVKELWNSHHIRKSGHETISGIPDLLYILPERYGGSENLQNVTVNDIEYVKENVLQETDNKNEYIEYFEYVVTPYPLEMPRSTEEAVEFLPILIQTGEEN